MTRPLTTNQAAILKRIAKNGGRDLITPALAKQLERRGLVEITGHKRQRTEWNRPVKGSTLWEVRLK